MTPDQIERLLNFDLSFPSVEIAAELSALETHISLLKDFVPTIQDQYRLRAKREVERKSLPDDMMYEEEQYIEHVRENVIPRAFFNSVLVMIWAAYESGMTDIATYLGKKESCHLSLSDIRARDFKGRLEKYFQGVLGLTLPINRELFISL